MTRLRLFASLVFVGVTVVNAGADPTENHAKHPWQWSDEERLRSRLDDEAAARRVANDRARRGRNLPSEEISSSAYVDDPADVIDGKYDPQLFFAFELFRHVVSVAYSNDPNVRSAWRRSKEEARVSLGLPDDFWNRLEGIVETYRHAQAEKKPTCRLRYEALVKAETTFGPGFLQFLYSSVAPDLQLHYSKKASALLLSIARGECE
jgi:hypothetical protein